MKHIKSINEFFDTEELKAQMELDVLRGNIDFKELVKDKNFIKNGDVLLDKLQMNCPFIQNLYYKKVGNLLNFGFQKVLKFNEKDEVYMYYVVEIVEHQSTKNYICNVYAKCFGNGQSLYNESDNMSISSYDKLVKFLNGNAFNILKDFTRYTYKNFKYKYIGFDNPKEFRNMNPRMN